MKRTEDILDAQRAVGGCETVGGIFLLISELQAETLIQSRGDGVRRYRS